MKIHVFAVRLKHNKEPVGIIAGKDYYEIFWNTDQITDPYSCEYRAIETGVIISWEGAGTEVKEDLTPDAEELEITPDADIAYDVKSMFASDEWNKYEKKKPKWFTAQQLETRLSRGSR